MRRGTKRLVIGLACAVWTIGSAANSFAVAGANSAERGGATLLLIVMPVLAAVLIFTGLRALREPDVPPPPQTGDERLSP